MKHSAYLDDIYHFHGQLAIAVGLNEAIVLRKLHSWIQFNTQRGVNLRVDENGVWRVWSFQTLAQWEAQLPFWSGVTIRRIFKNLKDLGVVIASDAFNDNRSDRTLWYTIDYDVYDRIMDQHKSGQAVADQIDHPPTGADQNDHLRADQNDHPSTLTGADQNDHLIINNENNTNRETGNTLKEDLRAGISKKDQRALELYDAFRSVRHPSVNGFSKSMWDSFKAAFRSLAVDGYSPEQVILVTRRLMKNYSDLSFVNPNSIRKAITSVLTDPTTGRSSAPGRDPLSPRLRELHEQQQQSERTKWSADGSIIINDPPPVKALRDAGGSVVG